MKIIVICSDIRSVHNVGSVFRTADAAGVDKIYLCGITPTPLDRFGKVRTDFSKVSLGAEESVLWEYAKSAVALIEKLKGESWQIVALEQSEQSIPYNQIHRSDLTDQNIALVLGAEVDGLPASILESVDKIIEIPMRGAMVRQAHHPRHTNRGKESLNVAVAFGVAVFELRHIDSTMD